MTVSHRYTTVVIHEIIFRCVFVGLLIASREDSSDYMADCTNLLSPCPPSLYEQLSMYMCDFIILI